MAPRDNNGRFMKRVVLRESRKGRNARGICAHKMTKGAKSARKQVRPSEPRPVTAYRMRLDRV